MIGGNISNEKCAIYTRVSTDNQAEKYNWNSCDVKQPNYNPSAGSILGGGAGHFKEKVKKDLTYIPIKMLHSLSNGIIDIALHTFNQEIA